MNGKTLAQQYHIPHPAVIAHRGLSYWAPETTRPALELAAALNPDMIEFDVQRTKDGVLVVFHDDTLARTTNVAEIFPQRVDDLLGSFTYQELQQLDAGSWFNAKYPERASPKFVQLRILTLEELLDIIQTFSNTTGLYLETKSPENFPGIEKESLALLHKKGWITADYEVMNRPIIVESFSLDSVQQFAKLAPKIPRSRLVNATMYNATGKLNVLKEAKEVGMGLGPAATLVTPWLVRAAHQHNLLVHTYTVNNAWHIRYLLFMGIDGFFTDRAELGLICAEKRKRIELEEIRKKLGY